jgi:hypothetical protein
MEHRRMISNIGLGTTLALLLSAPDLRADSSGDWSYTAAPYFWTTGMKGSAATLPPAPPADLDVSFSDVMDYLDMSLMGVAEARKGRFGLFGEVFYVGITADADTPGGFYSGANYEQDLWG